MRADQCVFLQTVTAECMQAGYCLGIGKTIQTDCTSNLFFEVFQQRFHCKRLVNSDDKTYPAFFFFGIPGNLSYPQRHKSFCIIPAGSQLEVKSWNNLPSDVSSGSKGVFFPHCLAGNIDIKTKNKYKVLLQKCGYLMEFVCLFLTLRVDELWAFQ